MVNEAERGAPRPRHDRATPLRARRAADEATRHDRDPNSWDRSNARAQPRRAGSSPNTMIPAPSAAARVSWAVLFIQVRQARTHTNRLPTPPKAAPHAHRLIDERSDPRAHHAHPAAATAAVARLIPVEAFADEDARRRSAEPQCLRIRSILVLSAIVFPMIQLTLQMSRAPSDRMAQDGAARRLHLAVSWAVGFDPGPVCTRARNPTAGSTESGASRTPTDR